MQASTTITTTTTNDMIVSCHMANGKNGFPRSLTSSLYCLKTRWRSAIRSSAMSGLLRGARCLRRARSVRPGRRQRAHPRGLLRPRRRRDAETNYEIDVQCDQPDDRRGQDQHVDRVEPADRVRVDERPALQELGYEGSQEGRRPVQVDPD